MKSNRNLLREHFVRQHSEHPYVQSKIVAIGGGKGGVGKTILSTMLGICLASSGKKVVIVDLDFAGANLHGYLKNSDNPPSLNCFLQRKIYNLNELVQETIFKNLYMIKGVTNFFTASQFKYWEKRKLVHNLYKIDADYVILDLGAGSSFTIIDFFLCADDQIIVSTCDSLAMHDAYGFIRVALLRKLEHTFRECPEFYRAITECGDLNKGRFAKSLSSVLGNLTNFPRSWIFTAENQIRLFKPKLIANMIREDDEPHEIQALRLAVADMLGVGLELWGKVRFDTNIRRAVQTLQPALLFSANGPASEDVVRLVNRHYIARELGARVPHWSPTVDSFSGANSGYPFRICNYRCIAWNNCPEKSGGLPCSVMNPVPLAKAAG
ncbi:AAA family ATPase [candidate division KSB1 bacterium]|nr:AAA family ATPase [candidate division KSB1 bacterium]